MGRITPENNHTGYLYPMNTNALYRKIYEVVEELPTENIKTTVIYCVPIEGEQNKYDMYLYIDNAWASVGSEVDLSDYYTKEETNSLLSGKASQQDLTENYRTTTYNSHYRPPCIMRSADAFQIGDVWICNDSKNGGSDWRDVSNKNRSYKLVSITPSAYVSGDYIYEWVATNPVSKVIEFSSPHPTYSSRIYSQNYGEIGSCGEQSLYSVGDFQIFLDPDQPVVHRVIKTIYVYTKAVITYSQNYNCYTTEYEFIEIPVPYNYYTKTEINSMIGDVESLLAQV